MSRSKKIGEKFLDESTTAKKGTRAFKRSLLVLAGTELQCEGEVNFVPTLRRHQNKQ